ncbi:hypothetical protein [Streptomyces sp. NPDC012508]|uniref:hypothetical protein n=1 Tax=Streptomyces sp. NPDC012508 TaxID=3364837 RepID=UPI0036A9DAF1
MIFIPACLSAVSGFMAAFGDKAFWGGMAAVSGAVAATASFLGGTKKAADFLISARAYTILRHRVKLELQLLSADADYAEVRQCVEDLNREYTQIVASDIPVPNRSFTVASRRIDAGAAS